jgi:hypothetical protein
LPTTQRRGHDGFQGFELLRGICSEIDFGCLHIRVSQPQRDLTEVPRGLQDDHRARMTQDMRCDVLLCQRGTARCSELHILVEHVGEAHTRHGTAVCAQEHFRHGEVPPHGQPRPEIIGRLCPQGERAFPASFALDLHRRGRMEGEGRQGSRQQFRYPQPSRKAEMDHGPIP